MSELRRILEQLDLHADSVVSTSFLKLRVSDSEQGALVLSANSEGLILLARTILGLAIDGQENSHVHLDANSLMDEADASLVIKKVMTPW